MKTRLLLFTLIVMSLVLAACGPQGAAVPADAVEAIKFIADKQQEIKTQHMDMSLDLALKLDGIEAPDASTEQMLTLFKNFKGNLTLAGDVDTTKNDAALKMSVDLGPLTAFVAQGAEKLELQMVKLGEKMYVKMGEEDWQETDVPAAATADKPDAQPQLSAQQLADLLKKAAKAEKLGDEKIDGVDSYHYKVSLDPLTLVDELVKIAQSTAGEAAPIDQAQMDEAKKFLKNTTVDVEVWVGKQDLFIRQQKIDLNVSITDIPDQPTAKVNVLINILAKSSKINEPVTITAPK